MTNILLLGANGQLGSDIVSMADEHPQYKVMPWTRKDLDVSSLESIEAILANQAFDVLINCTGYHKTDEVEAHAEKAFVINAFAAQALARVCSTKKATLFHISTDYVFGAPNQHQPLTEAMATGPVNIYGASKLMGESLALNACKDTFVLRVASLFGLAGSSGKGGNFVETMIRVGREKGQLNVVSDQMMSPTSTYDLAGMIFGLLKHRPAPGIYNAVNTGQASWYEFAKAIIEEAGVDATVDPVDACAFPTKAVRPSYSVLNNAKLSKVMGDIPCWEDALHRYVKGRPSR